MGTQHKSKNIETFPQNSYGSIWNKERVELLKWRY